MVELLLSHNASCDATDPSGTTPLMLAASKGHASLVRMLLAHKASPHAVDSQRWTPLLWAADCTTGTTEVVSLLLAAQANPAHTSAEHLTTPLMVQ